jgi:hypothetical protein
MKFVTSMSFWGATTSKYPFLAESSTGTVRLVQVMAEAELMKAATAAVKDALVMMAKNNTVNKNRWI